MTEAEGRTWLRDRCKVAGIKLRPDGRIGQAVMVEMLSREGYAIGPGTLNELERKGYFHPPGTGVWTGEEVVKLVQVLNYLRRWKPAPNQFDEMKTTIRRMLEAGDESAIKHLEGSTIELLLLHLVNSDDRDTREMIREAIIRRMNEVGFIEE